MISRSSLLGSISRAGLFNQASPAAGVGSFRTLIALSQCSQKIDAFPGTVKNSRTETSLQSTTLGNLGLNFGVLGIPKNVSFPNTFCCRSCFHSGPQVEVETGRTQRSTNYNEGLPLQSGSNGFGRFPLYPNRIVEANADVVHIKLMRNNAFVTLTDSKGNKKLGISAGKLAGKAGKLTRYSGEAAAEDIGHKVRQMKIKSVVVKVNGSTFFRKKKLAILSFKDGYSHSRADSHPVVYIEDTTRKPHNGCRRKKQRRI
ncbi:small ribosomal subunit protein uS11m [Primulina eburnea]|uniref:small ribosomal subunit protein uS11m n=1 Tax=Primulina eburnea TaxID=1245227 RepID=UPI003C6C4FDA